MCVHVDDGGDHLDAHLRPLHHARAGRGDRRRPLRQRDRDGGRYSRALGSGRSATFAFTWIMVGR